MAKYIEVEITEQTFTMVTFRVPEGEDAEKIVKRIQDGETNPFDLEEVCFDAIDSEIVEVFPNTARIA